MIAVNGDEKVGLENTQLYQKASRSSLTYQKTGKTIEKTFEEASVEPTTPENGAGTLEA